MSAFPIDPNATPAEQAFLDEYNALMSALRLLDAGERITGRPDEAERARLWARAHELERLVRNVTVQR